MFQRFFQSGEEFQLGFPLDAGEKNSYFSLVNCIRANYHSCEDGKTSLGLVKDSGAEFVWQRVLELHKRYRFRFRIFPHEKRNSDTGPDNIFTEGNSDFGACALAALQNKTPEQLDNASIVFCSCSYRTGNNPPELGLYGVMLDKVTNLDKKIGLQSLLNKYKAICKDCVNKRALALVLYESDAKMLGDALNIEPIVLKRNTFQKLLKEKNKKPAIVSCKDKDLPLLAKALKIWTCSWLWLLYLLLFLFIFLLIFFAINFFTPKEKTNSKEKIVDLPNTQAENPNGKEKIVDLPDTQSDYPTKVATTLDSFYVSGFCGRYNSIEKRAFLLKFSKDGNKIWEYTTPEVVNDSDQSPRVICTVGNSGNAYLVFFDTKKLLWVRKISSSTHSVLWEKSKEANSVILGAACTDNADGIWIAASQKKLGSFRTVYVVHYDSNGKLVKEITWGSSTCSGTAIEADGIGGCFISGFSNDEASDILLLHINSDDTVNFSTTLGEKYPYDMKPRELLKNGSSLYIAGGKSDQTEKYFPIVWKYNISDIFKPTYVTEIALPYEGFLASSEASMLRTDFGMKAIGNDGNILIGYSDSTGFWDKAFAIIDKNNKLLWKNIDGEPDFHENITGFFEIPSGIISIGCKNKAYSDHPTISLIRWNISQNPINLVKSK